MNKDHVLWLSRQKLEELLPLIPRNTSTRKLCLSAVAWCRHLWAEWPERDRQLAVRAELWADGLWTDFELQRVLPAPRYPYFRMPQRYYLSIGSFSLPWPAWQLFENLLQHVNESRFRLMNPQLCDLVRDVIPSPYQEVDYDPEWLTWHDQLIPKLALRMYDHGDFAELPVLGDALEEAGCCDRRILMHCRGSGPHVRGCWVIDLLLGLS